jgi:arsenate reductase
MKGIMTSTNSTDQYKVLFLCTGNSCRSQLAEAIVNSRFRDNWQAFSAGTKPSGYVHPLTTAVLGELGIHQKGRSKDVAEFIDTDFDLVVTVCDTAQEDCPVWLQPGKLIHCSFPDPAKVSGDSSEKKAAFRQVRDDIAIQITDILNAYLIEQDDPA